MAAPRLAKHLLGLKHRRKSAAKENRNRDPRRLHLEPLEDRRLMAQGPRLVAVVPNDEPQLTINPVATVSFPSPFPTAPRDLLFRFAQGNAIDPATLTTGFIVKSAGSDRILGSADDLTITPGLFIGDTPREVIMRFASTLPDNAYSVTLVGSGLTPLKDTSGNPFSNNAPIPPGTTTPPNPDLTVNFTLDLGAKVSAIVPQPISRNANGTLSTTVTVGGQQVDRLNVVEVYFDQQMQVSSADSSNVNKPSFYRLTDATTGAISLPSSITYSEDATLAFGGAGTTTLSYGGVSATTPLTVTNQVTRIAITNAGTNNTGSFTLTVNGATTPPIAAFGVTAANVLSALNTLPGMSGNVTVTQAAAPAVGTFDLTFVGALTGHSATVLLGLIGTGTAGTVTTSVVASNILASTIQSNLNSIAALAGKVSVTGPSGGPYTIQFIGSLSGQNVLPIVASVPTVVVPPGTTPPPASLPVATITSQPKAVLNFSASPILAGTYKLEIGTSPEPRVLETTTNAQHVGNSMSAPLQAYLGDSLVAGAVQANDVDLYRFELERDVADLAVTVRPTAGTTLDSFVRIFDSTGVQVQTINSGGAGGVDAANGIALTKGTYYVGVSANGNTAYSATTGAGASGGTGTGGYSLSVAFSDLVGVTDDLFIGPANPANVNNSSFDTATTIGKLGSAGRSLSGSILPNPDPLQAYNIDWPAAGDAPGVRVIPYLGQSDIQTPAGQSPDPTAGVEEITYDFQSFYGYTPQGVPLFNAITENQKQRAREIFELIAHYSGVQFREVDPAEDGSVLADISVVTGDLRAITPNFSPSANTTHTEGYPNIPTNQVGNPQNALIRHEFVIMNSLTPWADSQYGGQWFLTAMGVIGIAVGVGQHEHLPDLTNLNQGSNTEHVFPSAADVLYEQTLHRPESNDIDLYEFTVTEPGLFRAETVAERMATSTAAAPNLLNTVLTLYRETTDTSGKTTRTVVARNDDYYGNDSYLELALGTGTYYLGVTSTGNTEFDPTILNTGFGGRTQGTYNLSLSLKPDSSTTSLHDATGAAFDGDGDQQPGGTYQFFFQSNTPRPAVGNPPAPVETTIYVDKLSTVNQNAQQNPDLGKLGSPYNNLEKALQAANSSTTRKIVRIVGNDRDGRDSVGKDSLTGQSIASLADNDDYQIGFKDPNLVQPLADGGNFLVPKNVTVMIDAGAMFKMRRANLNAGTTPQGLVSRAGGSIQVLGTPNLSVRFTSYADDTQGGNDDGPGPGPQGGDYGGLVFRDDSDHERDFLSGVNTVANPLSLSMPVFLNYVNHVTMSYAGGKVTVDTVEDQYDPITLQKARPTLSHNTITKSGHAGMSATPNTFDDDGLTPAVPFDLRRIGPDIHDNTIVGNSINGLFIQIKTLAGSPLDYVDLTTRWRATDIVYVVQESLVVAGTPGGSIFPGTPSSTADAPPITTTLTDGRLRIDPGVLVKLSSRIETKISSAFLAEGSSALPITFTSLKDDKYGAGGSFDTNNDAAQPGGGSGPAPGQWGGFYFGPSSAGSLDHVNIFYGGGSVPIEGRFANFNAVDIEQADVRLANSMLKFNAGGGNAAGDDRNGRNPNTDAVIFVRGAQPIIVNNIIRDNNLDVAGNFNGTGPAISINTNAQVSTTQGDLGRSTGASDRLTEFDDNHGPLVRGNRLSNNTINGMEVRGETLTTETVWDDVDIVHTVFDEIIADNLNVFGGVRLQSSTSSSLVVKLQGGTAGFTATGTPLDISDRIGGTVQIIGQPGFPVVLTALSDDTVSAGFDPNGFPVFDTNNDGRLDENAPPTLPPATGPLQVTYDTSGTNLVAAMTLRPLPTGVTIPSATYTGQNTSAGRYINGDSVALGIPSQGIILSSGDANIPASNTQPSFTGSYGRPGDPDLTVLANLGNTGAQVPTNDAAVLTLTIDVTAGSGIQSGAFSFQFGSEEYPEFVGSPFNDVVGAFINGGAATNVMRDSRGNLVSVNSGFFDQPNTTGRYRIEYDGLTSALVARFPLRVGTNVLKIAIADALDTAYDSGVLISDLRFSTLAVGQGGVTRAPGPGEWRSVSLNQNSNDANVAQILETEPAYVGVEGKLDLNRTPQQAQFLGALAPNDKSGDDTRRLGFQVDGTIAPDNATDVDVYSFTADSGSEVWFDIDRTSYGLDAMLELIDADGNVIASATNTSPYNAVTTPVNAPLVTEITPGSATDNEVQQIRLNTPAGAAPYVFQLRFDDTFFTNTVYKTSTISSTATGADIQAAFLAIPGVAGNPGPFAPGDVTVTGNAGGPWLVTFAGQYANLNIAALFAGTSLPGLNDNVTLGVLPGDVGLAQSFDKDHYNGRDTYTTNGAGFVGVSSGRITNVAFTTDAPSATFNGGTPYVVTSPNHGLASGDIVQIEGVAGANGSNGYFFVKVVDQNQFSLEGTEFLFSNTPYASGGIWTRLVELTRDPIMRVVLPNAASGAALKNAPFFIRVRSQPAAFAGESGNTLNAGLTSGQYQLQVRVNQQDAKPGSTVRYADIRYATNGIEIHGLPVHSPLTGDTAEADNTRNDNQATAQFVGNLLQTDQNTISVGGQISGLGDVDWYQFDLNADLLEQFGSGDHTFASIFDIDYADGIARPDTTISVFDQNGTLIYVGRDGNDQADQPGAGQGLNADDLSRGSFGQFDAKVGSVHLPAGETNPGRPKRTYFVAVSTNRRLPTALDQTFNQAATAPNIRLEPIDSLGRIVEDHLNDAYFSETAQVADNQYVDSAGNVRSTFIDLTDKKSLGANVQPFNLGDVSLFVSHRVNNTTNLSIVNPLNGIRDMQVGTLDNGTVRVDDLTMRGDGRLYAYESVFTGTNTNLAGNVFEVNPSDASMTLLGADNITDQPNPPTTPATVQSVEMITTNTVGALAWAGDTLNPAANERRLYMAVNDFSSNSSALYVANWANGSTTVAQGFPWGRVYGNSFSSPLNLTNATRASASYDFQTPNLLVTFQHTAFGGGNGRQIHIRTDAALAPGAPPTVNVSAANANDVDVFLNPNGTNANALFTFGPSNSGNIQLTAVNVGTAGNAITFTFNRQPISATSNAPLIFASGNNIQITLNSNPAALTTGQALADAINDPTNGIANLVSAVAGGDPNATFTFNPAPVSLLGGLNPTTVQDLVNAINSKPALNILASFSPASLANRFIANTGDVDLTLQGGSLATGFTTGLAFGADNRHLFGVSSGGQFFQVDVDPVTGAEAFNATDPNGNPALIFQPTQVTVSGITSPIAFSGLTRGPLNLSNGFYADKFFASTTGGQLICLDQNGVALTVFDSDGDGAADAQFIQMVQGGNNGTTPLNNVTGLAFSNLDFNLWHPTTTRGGDPGHNITQSPNVNDSRLVPVPGNANASFYFGFETTANNQALGPYNAFPSVANSVTTTVPATVSNQVTVGSVAGAAVQSLVSDPTGTNSTLNQFDANPFDPSLSAVDGAYNGLTLTFTSGANAGASRTITSYIAASRTFTFTNAFPSIPADSDSFDIQVATNTTFNGDPFLSATDDFYRGKSLVFTSGPLTGQSQIISSYVGLLHQFNFNIGFNGVPGNGDQFLIQPTQPATTTRFDGDASLSSANGFYVGATVRFGNGTTDPALSNQSRIVSGYLGATHTFLFANPFPSIPADQDPFDVIITTPIAPEVLPDGGQFGILSRNTPTTGSPANQPALARSLTQDELAGNANIVNTYNFAGGAYGKLYSDAFSLDNVQPGDKPTFYFNYFLDTDNGGSTSETGNGRRAMTDSARVFIGVPLTGGGTRWDLIATNNPLLDNPGTSTVGGELPTFISQSTTELVANPHQQVQQLFNTDEWRQARIDLSRYAGLSNLKLRFDFSTAGTTQRDQNRTATGGMSSVNQFEDASYGGNFGNLQSTNRLQDNQHQGFFVDDFLVGLAGRGEMVTNAPQNETSFFPTPTPQQWMPGVLPPGVVTSGPYQLEVRRGADYAVNFDINNARVTLISTLDVNEQLVLDKRPVATTPTLSDGFESGNFNGNSLVAWTSQDDAPWSVTTAVANGGQFSAGSGPIDNGEVSGLTATVVTGTGQISFARGIQSDTGDFLRFYIDGVLATTSTGQSAEWTGNLPFQTFTFDISAGRHTFRWSYEKDAADPVSPGLDRAFIDDFTFPTPQVGVSDVYDAGNSNYVLWFLDPALHSASARLVTPSGTFPFMPNGLKRGGDKNTQRPQGHIQIEQNSIDLSSQSGILVDTGPRDANTRNPYATPRNLPTLSSDRLVPGVTLANNVISNPGLAGITFSGDTNAPVGGLAVPVAAVPFGRIENNTVYGGAVAAGAGIVVGPNAGPTLINNIIANTATAITIDPTSLVTTVVGANLYAGNTAQGTTAGTNAIFLNPTDPLFKDPARRNFYLQAGSQAIDSSLNTLPDRPSIAAVKSAVGIPQSPILAPDRDMFGQLRLDDPNQNPPPGLGQNIFKDRGAVERADFSPPIAFVSDPLDNDSARRDRNSVVNDVAIRNENLQQFVIRFTDVGIGIDDLTARLPSQYKIYKDGVLLLDQTAATPNYRFVYNESTNEAFFTPTEGVWELNHTYTIVVNNTAPGTLDAQGLPLPAGVLDQAGNPVLANRANGETSFNIFVGTLYDFGDAPDPTFPTLFNNNGAVHVVEDGFFLGSNPTNDPNIVNIDEENEAKQTPLADGDLGDDGVQFVNVSAGLTSTIVVTATIPTGMTGKLDAWFDLNHDGIWTQNEKLIDHDTTAGAGSLQNGPNTFTFKFGDAATLTGPTMARFRFSSTGVDLPTGFGRAGAVAAPDGEVEDYRFTVGGPPYQNANNLLDVNNDGQVTPGDALTVINYINLYRLLVPTGNISLPPTSPPFPAPAPVLNPAGNGPGLANYVDVNGNGFIDPDDANRVITFINQRRTSGNGEGEGTTATLMTSVVTTASDSPSAAVPGTMTIPSVLLAAPDIVLEVRESQSQPAAAPAQIAQSSTTVARDQALLDFQVADELTEHGLRLATTLKAKAPIGPLDEASWEDLLNSLANEQNDSAERTA